MDMKSIWPRIRNRFTLLPLSFNYLPFVLPISSHAFFVFQAIIPIPSDTIPQFCISPPLLDLRLHNRPCRLNGVIRRSGIRRLGRPGKEPALHRLGSSLHLHWSSLLQMERPIVIYFLAQQPAREWAAQQRVGTKWENRIIITTK